MVPPTFLPVESESSKAYISKCLYSTGSGSSVWKGGPAWAVAAHRVSAAAVQATLDRCSIGGALPVSGSGWPIVCGSLRIPEKGHPDGLDERIHTVVTL